LLLLLLVVCCVVSVVVTAIVVVCVAFLLLLLRCAVTVICWCVGARLRFVGYVVVLPVAVALFVVVGVVIAFTRCL
jgi:hypothetical protein